MNVVDLNSVFVGNVVGLFPGGFTVRTASGAAMRLGREVIFGVDGGVQLICTRAGVGAYEVE